MTQNVAAMICGQGVFEARADIPFRDPFRRGQVRPRHYGGGRLPTAITRCPLTSKLKNRLPIQIRQIQDRNYRNEKA